MKLVPPQRNNPYLVTITAEGSWADDQTQPFVPPAKWSIEHRMSPDEFRRNVTFTISQQIRANSPESAIADAITKTNHMQALYPGWLNDAAAYSIIVEHYADK